MTPLEHDMAAIKRLSARTARRDLRWERSDRDYWCGDCTLGAVTIQQHIGGVEINCDWHWFDGPAPQSIREAKAQVETALADLLLGLLWQPPAPDAAFPLLSETHA